MKRIALVLIASAALCAPALAEDLIVKSPSVGVTVGSGPDRVVRERESFVNVNRASKRR